ncbi:MAG TPA: FAD-dependent monooxygenase [Azospirillaceae bacterium]|nr:FAD-dependent monooxygenase [Azospirillaceae bacterium]
MAAEGRVLIVGAGPVGLVCALSLARSGVPVRLLEANTGLPRDLRASTFHPPTLDMLDRLGLAAPLIAAGLVTPTWQIRLHATHEKAEFDLSVLADETAHPYRLQCEQDRLTALALEALRAEPLAEIWFGVTVESVDQDGDGVTVLTRRDGERLALRAPWLVGADGARSVVRKSVGLEFAGETYPETTILATTRFPFEEHLPGLSNVNYVWAPGGTFSLLRLPGFWRCSLHTAAGESVEEVLTPEGVERKLQAIVPRPTPYEVQEVRPYRIHQRVVETYRVGRVLLAGDAAHLNSPSGGMGMNGGVHDAVNLSDKLARVWRGGDDALLDLYVRQRRPIAVEEILAQADRNRARMRETSDERRREMLRDLQDVAADPVRAKAHLMRSSMIEGLRRAEAIR